MAYRTLKNFGRMWQMYPHGTVDEVKALIGGKVAYDWITNTCTIRVSRSMNYAGHPVPPNHAGLNTVAGGDGLHYAFRVREFQRYLNEVYGPATYFTEYPAVGGDVPEDFLGRKGIISFTVPGWTDATGHFDLWNGAECAHHGYFDQASAVYLWEVLDAPHLGGSVGRGGENHPGDVMTVQQLLLDAGYDPGPVDGKAGDTTCMAIERFQRGFLRHPDGRVDVEGRTWRELLGLG